MPRRVFFYSETPLKFPSPLPQGSGGKASGEHVREETTEEEWAVCDRQDGKTEAIFGYLFGSEVSNYNF